MSDKISTTDPEIMLIQDERSCAVELLEKVIELEQNKCSVSNYAEDVPVTETSRLHANIPHDNMPNDSKKKPKKRRKDSANSHEKRPSPSVSCSDNEGSTVNKISKSDLEELQRAYKRCKAIVTKIESQYGHLLDLPIEPSPHGIDNTNEVTEGKCTCKLGKKIVFDESGNEIPAEQNISEHICPHKLLRRCSDEKTEQNNVQIEYSESNEFLPDDLKDLVELLRSKWINKSYRYRVISKIQFKRQEYADKIRQNKKSLIEQLKTENPKKVLRFKGTNLSELMGYK